MGLYRYQSFNDNVFDPMHHARIANTTLLEMILKLCQVPFARVLIVLTATFISILLSTSLNVIFILLIDRVISQMDVSLFCGFLTVSIFLSCESGQSLFEEVDF